MKKDSKGQSSKQSKESKSKEENQNNSNYSEEWKHPFQTVNHNGEVRITIAGGLASRKKFKTIEEAEEYIETKPWDLIQTVSIVAYHALKEMEKQMEKEE